MLCFGDRQEQLNIKPRPYPSFIAKRGDWELKVACNYLQAIRLLRNSFIKCYFVYFSIIKKRHMVNWTEEELKEKMKEYSAKADDTSNSYFDRDVFRQLYYHYKILLMDKQNENN
jgi:hypothetical protein